MRECRTLVLAQMERTIPRSKRYRSVLYDLMVEYPLREAKALRPALCIATCRAFGGHLEAVLPTACVLELYHNAFLIHDDVEDDSDRRRDRPTLHRSHGVPVAMNVGDAMLALCLEPLLDNTRLLGLGKALLVLQVVSRMARESSEGQALELAWCRRRRWDLTAVDYLRMIRKKTSHYTFIAPGHLGAIIGGADPDSIASLRKFASALGTAFQIQDDVLNLASGEAGYGKDHLGDLWEGKHTLIVLHMLQCATPAERAAALEALGRPRAPRGDGRMRGILATLELEGSITKSARGKLEAAVLPSAEPARGQAEVDLLFFLIRKYGSLDHARQTAGRSARRAAHVLARLGRAMRPSVHRDFLEDLSAFVADRGH
jgi:geranylgeranyl diphosphate synthase type II